MTNVHKEFRDFVRGSSNKGVKIVKRKQYIHRILLGLW